MFPSFAQILAAAANQSLERRVSEKQQCSQRKRRLVLTDLEVINRKLLCTPGSVYGSVMSWGGPSCCCCVCLGSSCGLRYCSDISGVRGEKSLCGSWVCSNITELLSKISKGKIPIQSKSTGFCVNFQLNNNRMMSEMRLKRVRLGFTQRARQERSVWTKAWFSELHLEF